MWGLGARTPRGIAECGDKAPELARGTADAELLHPVSKGAGVEAEDLGGAAGAGDDPVGLLEHGDDVFAFHGCQGGLAWCLSGDGRGGVAGRGFPLPFFRAAAAPLCPPPAPPPRRPP